MASIGFIPNDKNKFNNELNKVMDMQPPAFTTPREISHVIPMDEPVFWSDVKRGIFVRLSMIGLFFVCVLLVFIDQGVVL